MEKFKMLIEEQNRLECLKSRDELTEQGLQLLTELNQALQLLQSRVIESVCINCGQERDKHSKASELCPDRFMHYEQTVL